VQASNASWKLPRRPRRYQRAPKKLCEASTTFRQAVAVTSRRFRDAGSAATSVSKRELTQLAPQQSGTPVQASERHAKIMRRSPPRMPRTPFYSKPIVSQAMRPSGTRTTASTLSVLCVLFAPPITVQLRAYMKCSSRLATDKNRASISD